MTIPNNKDILFMQLVMQNQQLALMAMGKISNPEIQGIEKNLDLAKMVIDTLDMLVEKTKGNLSDYEDKYLNDTIKELKLEYVNELNNDKGNTT